MLPLKDKTSLRLLFFNVPQGWPWMKTVGTVHQKENTAGLRWHGTQHSGVKAACIILSQLVSVQKYHPERFSISVPVKSLEQKCRTRLVRNNHLSHHTLTEQCRSVGFSFLPPPQLQHLVLGLGWFFCRVLRVWAPKVLKDTFTSPCILLWRSQCFLFHRHNRSR